MGIAQRITGMSSSELRELEFPRLYSCSQIIPSSIGQVRGDVKMATGMYVCSEDLRNRGESETSKKVAKKYFK